MRFLKNKIARALQLAQSHQASESDLKTSVTLKTQQGTPDMEILPQDSPQQGCPRKRKTPSGNNIMKNYARALVNFGLSPLARPYLINEDLSYEKFKQTLKAKRKNVNCIKGLRGLLLQERRDSKDMRVFKMMFQRSCEAFLKYYSVNWIFHSKVDDKLKHLSYRGKILRRVRNPEYFTYLEDFVRRKNY